MTELTTRESQQPVSFPGSRLDFDIGGGPTLTSGISGSTGSKGTFAITKHEPPLPAEKPQPDATGNTRDEVVYKSWRRLQHLLGST
jgi:hypothetical protein